MNSIVLGGGCFWCLEAVFQRVKGVSAVKSGYAGGHTENPEYREVCAESTGHAEVVKVEYNESVISLKELLNIFFIVHDPTTLNLQGNDRGTQYRSIILPTSDDELAVIKSAIEDAQAHYADKIVTQIEKLQTFWPAETYHDNYYNQNQQQPYCQLVVGEKVAKLHKYFADYTE